VLPDGRAVATLGIACRDGQTVSLELTPAE